MLFLFEIHLKELKQLCTVCVSVHPTVYTAIPVSLQNRGELVTTNNRKDHQNKLLGKNA